LRGGGATASLWAGNKLREADDDSPVKDEPFLLYEEQVGMSYRQGF